jgi:TonB family protein
MIKFSQRAGKTLIMIALGFCLFSTVTPRLDAQWYWSSGIIENGGVTVFPSRGITASGKTVIFQSGKKPLVKSDVITTVSPKYPIDERTNRHQGAGFFRMTIDPKTGLVTQILVETSTGFKALDDSVIHAGLQWRWRPATWKEFVFSCNFQDWVGYK